MERRRHDTDAELQACCALLCIRCDYFMHLLHGSSSRAPTCTTTGILHQPSPIDLRPFDIDLKHGEHLLRYMCSGAAGSSSPMPSRLPHASAPDGRPEEAVRGHAMLVVDADNAAALQEVAERCYATRRYMCEGVLNSLSFRKVNGSLTTDESKLEPERPYSCTYASVEPSQPIR